MKFYYNSDTDIALDIKLKFQLFNIKNEYFLNLCDVITEYSKGKLNII